MVSTTVSKYWGEEFDEEFRSMPKELAKVMTGNTTPLESLVPRLAELGWIRSKGQHSRIGRNCISTG
jgi:hypothetical protein